MVRQLPRRVLETEVEQLLPEVPQPLLQIRLVERTQLLHLHDVACTTASFSTRRVWIGSLCAASFKASIASSCCTPPTSNMTRPGRTTATQWSGAPLPPPIRVSAGFAVADLSGKTRIHTLPPRLRWWVMVRRAASICRAVIHAGSRACRPISPKVTRLPVDARPRMRPRCDFRYLTRFGWSIALVLVFV